MENNKQSSVDWLFQKLWDEPKDKLTWYAILKQAKAMHKQEIIETYTYNSAIRTQNKAENYYREKYGKDNADNTAV